MKIFFELDQVHLAMSDPGVEPLEILEILELETPPYPRPPCRRLPCRLVR